MYLILYFLFTIFLGNDGFLCEGGLNSELCQYQRFLENHNSTTDETISTINATTFIPIIKKTCFDSYKNCRNFKHLCYVNEFHEMMHKDCSLTCEYCDYSILFPEIKTDCLDKAPNCKKFKSLCHHPKYQFDMLSICQETCGHCNGTCLEQLDRCDELEKDGFCQDDRYTEKERKYICGKTCKFC